MHKTLLLPCAMGFCLVALGVGQGGASAARAAAPDEGRLDVHAAWSDDGGRITSQAQRGGEKVLHGVQVITGPRNWLKEYAVYNQGVLEQRTQFYLGGRVFRLQRREANGDGAEAIYSAERTKIVAEQAITDGGVDIGPIRTQDAICQGVVKGDRRWDGRFLVREPIPNGYGLRLMLHEYRQGALIARNPFPAERLGLPKENQTVETWLWEFPDWPLAP